jgi:hypothetical protein
LHVDEGAALHPFELVRIAPARERDGDVRTEEGESRDEQRGA